MNATTMPAPLRTMSVKDFANLAHDQGKTFSDLLVELWPDADKTPATVTHA